MYSAYYGLIPKAFCDLCHKTEQRPYNQRRRDALNISKYNHAMVRTSLSYCAVLCRISSLSHIDFPIVMQVLRKRKKDQALLDKLCFEKELCLITKENDDSHYF